ncbi:MAG: hypothetical protein HC903_05305 [Methylacidiphilales bacterium]|nr:hypothetical protein [Candidatus Methylacidiphilales bacterium]NJR14830.1 hypothetical protein [Calothrix sp. CSU_2_0]
MKRKLWQELDDKQAETVSGGMERAEGCLAWSIRFGDVRRSSLPIQEVNSVIQN